MKIYISAGERFVTSPIERLKSLLGMDFYSKAKLSKAELGKCNFVIFPDYYGDSADTWVKKVKEIGGKYVTKRYGSIYFYFDMSKFDSDYQTELQKAKDDYAAELNAIDIDQYKPSSAIIQKIMDYRSRGSKVNVGAIKDLKKLLTYYYTAKLIGWGELANNCENEYMRSKFPGKYFDKDDLLKAINRRVQVDSQYADTRTDFEKKYDLPDSKGLFTFEERSCWVPKKVLMYFIENNIPVHFGRRTSGAGYDRNGRQWSEVEHFTMFPDSDNPINYVLVVHTDEGGGPTTYTSAGAGERVSAKKVVDDIDRKIRRFRG